MIRRFALLCLLACPTPLSAGALPSGPKASAASVVRAVTPGVVNIATKRIESVEVPTVVDPVLQEFFEIPNTHLKRETTSAGSGVIVDAEAGLILTNEHVVRGASVIEATTKDGRRFRAQLVGRDKATDIAVLKIKADNLAAVPMGDSRTLEVGDFVLAVGNPFGLGQTVTSGIVSAIGRAGLGIEGYEDFIQTDASINPGNSGGALVTLDGRLVGLNTAILSKSGASHGIGFAIPIDMARRIMAQLVESGEVRRGHIGVSIRSPSGNGAGAEIVTVEPASSAALAGLRKGDVVTAVDGRAITTPAQLRAFLGASPAGSEIEVRFHRSGEAMQARLRIEASQKAAVR
ncbi:trypsin-like peptidase domain-containing protein [Methylocystis sp. JR02]|uniref:S1C family serine protease n=1 Tax=Methylocystis sp. JR02 TaxID=3046284 RepID=UPI0024BA8A40|nr:trypsin-like peptidase domain-containing protein [Methylocystis sp. JR02]MDJ0449565.1 trypsin-like peptidase domain-containing protein [Methylocystis sp. JR02]